LAKSKNKVLELGEIVINVACLPVGKDKISDKNYLTVIIAHSLLHLLGYHHEKSVAEAKKIERLEERILKYLKI
ncbi:MAG: rRNA maturation RNAse YbeY, partial [Patescibacteria group bacterium]